MKRRLFWVMVAVVLVCLSLFFMLFLLEMHRGEPFSQVETTWPQVTSFTLQSEAFSEGQSIPSLYTCQGKDISPPLAWDDPPPGTRSFALIIDDPDAPLGVWVHWVVYNIPPEMRSLPADFRPAQKSPVRFAKNSWGKQEYGGPCPPSGTHRYVFRLYALDTVLAQEISDKAALLQAIEDHVLVYAELVGVYSRR